MGIAVLAQYRERSPRSLLRLIGRPDKLTLDSEKLVPQPGVATSGDADWGALEQFLAIGFPITMNVRNVYVSGDIALVIANWSLKGRGADGSDADMSGSTADVARRGANGWKFVVDNPFGTGPASR